MGEIAERASLPIHVALSHDVESRYAFENELYCRECRHRFGGAYGAISSGATDWRFCPYCGVEIVPTNPYWQPVEIVVDDDRWWFHSWPDVLDGTIEGTGHERIRFELGDEGEHDG